MAGSDTFLILDGDRARTQRWSALLSARGWSVASGLEAASA